MSQFQPVIFRNGVTNIVSIKKTSASMPVVRIAKFTGLAPSLWCQASQPSNASGTAALTSTSNLAKRMSLSFMAVLSGQKFARRSIPAYKPATCSP